MAITICNFSIHCYDYFRVKRMILLLVKLNDNFDSKCICDLGWWNWPLIDRKLNSDHPSRVDIPIMLRSNVIELKHSKFNVSRSRHDVPKKKRNEIFPYLLLQTNRPFKNTVKPEHNDHLRDSKIVAVVQTYLNTLHVKIGSLLTGGCYLEVVVSSSLAVVLV